MAVLSEEQYLAFADSPMRQLPCDAEPPFDFGDYFDAIPGEDFGGHVCHGDVTYVYEDAQECFQHVLFNSEDRNVFMVVILDLAKHKVAGHRLLDINELYGLDEALGAGREVSP
jgi:hypothetical protein